MIIELLSAIVSLVISALNLMNLLKHYKEMRRLEYKRRKIKELFVLSNKNKIDVPILKELLDERKKSILAEVILKSIDIVELEMNSVTEIIDISKAEEVIIKIKKLMDDNIFIKKVEYKTICEKFILEKQKQSFYNMLILFICAIFIAIIKPNMYAQIFVLVYLCFDLLHIMVIKYRYKNNLYGTCEYEAKQLICYLVSNNKNNMNNSKGIPIFDDTACKKYFQKEIIGERGIINEPA